MQTDTAFLILAAAFAVAMMAAPFVLSPPAPVDLEVALVEAHQ